MYARLIHCAAQKQTCSWSIIQIPPRDHSHEWVLGTRAASLTPKGLEVHRDILRTDRFAIIEDGEVEAGTITNHLDLVAQRIVRQTFTVRPARQSIPVDTLGPGNGAQVLDSLISAGGGREDCAVVKAVLDHRRWVDKLPLILASNRLFVGDVVALDTARLSVIQKYATKAN